LVTQKTIEESEKKYFNYIFKLLSSPKTTKKIKKSLKDLNNNLNLIRNYDLDNIIAMPLQEQYRLILMEYAVKKKWNGITFPASSDVFFETSDCILMIDIKTVKMIDSDIRFVRKNLSLPTTLSTKDSKNRNNTRKKMIQELKKNLIKPLFMT